MSRADEELRRAEISTVAGELHYQFPRGIDPVAYSDAARHVLDAVLPDHDRQLLEQVMEKYKAHPLTLDIWLEEQIAALRYPRGQVVTATPDELREAAYALGCSQHALETFLAIHDRQLRERVQAIPRREWDENDADSMAANTARAYNSGLAAALAALAAPTELLCDCPPATQDPSGDYCLNCGHLILAAARP